MKRTIFTGTCAGLFFLTGCGTGEQDEETPAQGLDGADSQNHSEPEPGEKELQISDEVTDKDFVFKIRLDDAYYEEYEDISLHAELTYTGDQDEIEITHNPSPFWFPMEELDRGYDIGYHQVDMGGGTTLEPGKTMTETFEGPAGGFGETDPEEYRKFMEDIHENDGFPAGHYVVNGYVEFTVMSGEREGERITLEGEVEFIVSE
ncbi:hypothetical protein CR205_12125 [Alteribacter lacisalsi]|uniref:Uncharacterized protein n=1 Tax=Alteribacter lacisalsi TaxID=2045244 RepID=A0A2W0H665_9BACI|nr:hypothetical protein [Alteribacter lacisalsi]PYZ96461.1 hypothetical protein CR205_12125 [Alteribacter lacisalsi]